MPTSQCSFVCSIIAYLRYPQTGNRNKPSGLKCPQINTRKERDHVCFLTLCQTANKTARREKLREVELGGNCQATNIARNPLGEHLRVAAGLREPASRFMLIR